MRLACVRPAANVRSEPGSNSPIKTKSFSRRSVDHRNSQLLTALDPKTHLSSASRLETHELSFTSSIYYLVFRDRKICRDLQLLGPAAGAVLLPQSLETVKKNFEEFFFRFAHRPTNFSSGGGQLLTPLRSYRQPFFSTGFRFSLRRFCFPALRGRRT